jgi:outer membrane protein OmpA-like peptidoglycan-associated protein
MPPLAVVGYGIATLKMHIAMGSFLLFMTNLLAIALSVALLARWYRFTTSDSPVSVMWQTVLTLATFAALSVPLGLALVDIGRKTVVGVTVRAEIERQFEGRRSSIESLDIAGGRGEPLEVAATVLTPVFRAGAESAVAGGIARKLGQVAQVSIDQVVVSREDLDERISRQAAETALIRKDLEPLAKAYRARQEAVDAVKAAVFFPVRTLDVEPEAKRIRVEPTADAAVGLRALRQLEASLRTRFPGWDITVIPVVGPLPSLYFESGRENFLIGQHEAVADIVWALKAWQVGAVTVTGFASSTGSTATNRSLAQRRAEWVAESLRAAGFDALVAADVRVPGQRDLERRFGVTYFQRVDIRLGKGPQPPSIPGVAG